MNLTHSDTFESRIFRGYQVGRETEIKKHLLNYSFYLFRWINRRRSQRWADKDYKKANLGEMRTRYISFIKFCST